MRGWALEPTFSSLSYMALESHTCCEARLTEHVALTLATVPRGGGCRDFQGRG